MAEHNFIKKVGGVIQKLKGVGGWRVSWRFNLKRQSEFKMRMESWSTTGCAVCGAKSSSSDTIVLGVKLQTRNSLRYFNNRFY